MNLCNGIKWHKQLEREKVLGRKVIEDFCEQMGLLPLDPKLLDKKKKKKIYKSSKPYLKKKYRKNEDKPESSIRRKKKQPVCYKCHRTSHYANKCKMKKKINSLSIDEGLKKTLEKLFLSVSDSDKEIYNINNSEETSSDEGSEDSSSYNGKCDYYKALCKANELCPLSKKENFILEIIDQIEDKEKKKKAIKDYLQEHNKSFRNGKEIEIQNPAAYSLKEILQRIKTPKYVEANNNDLAREIKILKSEIADLKTRVTILELVPQNLIKSEVEE